MKTLALAFASTAAGSIAFYVILSLFGLGENALHIALIPLLGTSHLYELMEKNWAKRNLSMSPKSIFTFEGFAIPWYVMILYGAFICIGLAEGISGVGGIMARLTTPADASYAIRAPIMKAVQLPLTVLAFYLLGFWIGSRCAAHGLIVTIVSIFLGHTLMRLLDVVLMPESAFEVFYGRSKDLAALVPGFLFGTSVLSILTILGFWRGSRTRMSKYLQYLLAVLPPETRTTIVNLAYEEARTAAAKMRTASPVST